MRSTRSPDTSANYSEGTVSIERTTSALVDHRLEGRAPHGRRRRLDLPTRMRLIRVPTAEQLPGRRSPGGTMWQRDLGWGAGSPQNHLLLRACPHKVARFRAVKCETGLALHLQPRTAMTVKFRVRVARSWWSPASQIHFRVASSQLNRAAGPSGEEDLPCELEVVTKTLSSFTAVSFALCVGYGLLVPAFHAAWLLEALLPGFKWLSVGSFALGVIESALYGA